MSNVAHHAIVVTTHTTFAEAALLAAAEAGCDATHLYQSGLNGYATFAVLPDGSKEGWSESDAGDAARDLFVKWLYEQEFEDGSSPYTWVEVNYGDLRGTGQHGARITRSAWKDRG